MTKGIWDEKPHYIWVPRGYSSKVRIKDDDIQMLNLEEMDAWLKKLMKRQQEDKQILIDRINDLEEKLQVVAEYSEDLQGYKVQLLPDEEKEKEAEG